MSCSFFTQAQNLEAHSVFSWLIKACLHLDTQTVFQQAMAQFCCASSSQSSPLTFIPKSSFNFRAFSCSTTRFLSLGTASRRRLSLTAALASVPSAEASGVDCPDKKILLEVKDLTAVIAESKQQILNGVNLVVHEGEVRNSLLHLLIEVFFPSVWLIR